MASDFLANTQRYFEIAAKVLDLPKEVCTHLQTPRREVRVELNVKMDDGSWGPSSAFESSTTTHVVLSKADSDITITSTPKRSPPSRRS